MYQIRLNKSSKSITLKKIEKNIRLVQKLNRITLKQTGRKGPKGDTGDTGPQGPQGPPGSDATDKNFVQVFTNQSTITVDHNLGKYPAVSVSDSTGEEVIGNIEHTSVNQLIATFSSSFTGRIICN